MSGTEPADVVPASVSLGEVVPPEDPEDWTRPLTWVVAAGMVAGPMVAAAWMLLAPPMGAEPQAGTFLVAAVIGAGAALTGATQRGVARAWTATLGAGLFAALLTAVVGVVAAGERQVGVASPTVSHAVAASLAGLGGAGAAAAVAAAVARVRVRGARLAVAGLAGSAVAVAALGALFGGGS